MPTLEPERLEQLLQRHGVAREFIEFSGAIRQIALSARLHILAMLGVEVEGPEALEKLLQEQELTDLQRCLPTVVALAEGESGLVVTLESTPGLQLQWRLRCEDGSEREARVDPVSLPLQSSHAAGQLHFEKRWLELGQLPTGYHWLELDRGDGNSKRSMLVVSPRQAWQGERLQAGARLWGLSAQLYSLRTQHNWGIGDFADLRLLVEGAAAAGAHFILLNPLHALDLRYPENASPYSPDDRRFLNPLYLALSDCEEFHAEPVQRLVQEAAFAAELARLRATEQVAYSGVQALKLRVLEQMYRVFAERELVAGSTRAGSFQAFVEDGGGPLASFIACQAKRQSQAGVLADARFHAYLQWMGHEQLQACQRHAETLGMPLGLVRDLAVGSSVDGCEVLGNPGLFCTAARIGAPPDNFNPDGQNWGLPPLHPRVLLERHCAHFIELLRSNMRDCGALRIDHVMSLMRLWWCPDDGSNAAGAYVHYPVDLLFAILRLESVRNQCVVIGEDLGVVPPEIRGYLDGGGIYSNSVFYFEKYDGWHFRKPEHFKPQALAMIANHDVPPLAAWWNGGDLLLRRALGLIQDEAGLLAERERRTGEKWQLLQWLAEQSLLPAAWWDRNLERPWDAVLAQALVRACGRSASRLLSLQLDDLAAAELPVNIPGTSDEYPNWRRKLPLDLEELFKNTEAQALLQALREERG